MIEDQNLSFFIVWLPRLLWQTTKATIQPWWLGGRAAASFNTSLTSASVDRIVYHHSTPEASTRKMYNLLLSNNFLKKIIE